MLKVLITNSVALNGGDEALLRSTIEGIRSKVNSSSFLVLTNTPQLCNSYFPDIAFDNDWEFVFNKYSRSLIDRCKAKARSILKARFNINYFSSLSQLFAPASEKRIFKAYKEADIIVSSAGGYIHDFYTYQQRAIAYRLCIYLKKKYFFFGQSIGPFWNENEYRTIVPILNSATGIFLRESISKKHLESIGIKNENTFITTDVAFSYYKFHPDLFIEKKTSKVSNVVMSFRRWQNEEVNESIKQKASSLIVHLVKEKGLTITFLSTCQGIPEYVNDSDFAKEICKGMDEEISRKIFFDDKKYGLQDLIKRYSAFDIYIGMRLHGAILSMLGGTPAFNISYEKKTEGIFNYLEVSENYIDYENEYINWETSIDRFIGNYQIQLTILENKVSQAADCSMQNVDLLLKLK